VGGKTAVTFGEVGAFVEPIRLIVAGRASTRYRGHDLPVRDVIEKTIRSYMQAHFLIPDIDRDLTIEHRWTNAAGPGTIKESAGAIAEMFTPSDATRVRGYGRHYVANDTSLAVAYAPLSRLEQAILEAEALLNSKAIKQRYPWLGSDIKLMGVRVREQVDLTVCVPQIARFVKDLPAYQANLRAAAELLLACFSKHLPADQLQLSLNTKDNLQDHNFYLTVTGASLSGDVGVTGRGNRPNGLITGNRPMSMEAAAGKNPRYYAGIVYNMAAQEIARRLYEAIGKPNCVEIVSQNGAPLLAPWHAIVTIDSQDEQIVREIVVAGIQRIPELTEQFVRGEITLY
jgi:S-adenosylmethionine synthetase